MREVLSGSHSILAGLLSGIREVGKIYLFEGRKGDRFREIIRLAQEKGISIEWKEWSFLSSLCPNDHHQGAIAIVEGQRYFGLEESLIEAKKEEGPALFLILDRIQDSGNLGSILRSAESAGANGVIIPKDRAAGWGPGVYKSSAGAHEYVKLIRVTNLVAAMKRMKEAGIWIVGADQTADKVYHEVDLRVPVAIAIGGEGEGLRRLTKENCDILVKIPMKGRISCLNAGVAAGILTFEILRQRDK